MDSAARRDRARSRNHVGARDRGQATVQAGSCATPSSRKSIRFAPPHRPFTTDAASHCTDESQQCATPSSYEPGPVVCQAPPGHLPNRDSATPIDRESNQFEPPRTPAHEPHRAPPAEPQRRATPSNRRTNRPKPPHRPRAATPASFRRTGTGIVGCSATKAKHSHKNRPRADTGRTAAASCLGQAILPTSRRPSHSRQQPAQAIPRQATDQTAAASGLGQGISPTSHRPSHSRQRPRSGDPADQPPAKP